MTRYSTQYSNKLTILSAFEQSKIMKKLKQRILATHTTSGMILFCSIIIFIGMIGSLAIDMYVPSMPGIANTFATTAVAVKLSITLYLLAYAIGIFFYGPIIDSFGRKPVILVAITVGLIGSILCFLSDSITTLYIGRFLQGAGFAAINVAAPAMARDIFDDKQFAQVSSILSMFFGLGPIFSPIIGSYIDHYFGWRTVFSVLSVYSILVILVVIFAIPETHEEEQHHVFHIKPILKTYWNIAKNNIFLANTLSKSVAYAGFMIFYTVTPFMLQKYMGLTVLQYGWITLALTGAIFITKFINTIALAYVDVDKIIFLSIIMLAIAGSLLLLFGILGYYSLFTLLLPFMLFGIGSGFLFSNTMAAAFKPFKGKASGSVSGLLNGTQLFAAFIGSAIAAHLGITSLLPLGILMAVMSIGVVVQYVYFMRRATE